MNEGNIRAIKSWHARAAKFTNALSSHIMTGDLGVYAHRALLIISFSSSIAVWLLLHWRSIITEENLSTQENELWKIEQQG
jgi:hypothetical protein